MGYLVYKNPPSDYDEVYWRNYTLQERGRGEKPVWYNRYIIYRNLMENRRIELAFDLEQKEREKRGFKVVKKSRGWKEMAQWYRWNERASEWDRAQELLDEARVVRARKALREDEVNVASQLKERAIEILALPLTKKVIEKVEVDPVTKRPIAQYITIMPIRASMGDAVKMMEMYSKLTRLGLDMNTEKQELVISNQVKNDTTDFWQTVSSDPTLADLAFDFLQKVQERQKLNTPDQQQRLQLPSANFREIEEDDDA